MHKPTALKKEIRPMTVSDLDMVLQWRNHEDVRRYMYTQHEITRDEHKRWFELGSKDKNRHLMIFELSGRAVGFVHFNRHGDVPVADWGFYLAPDAQKGSGQHLGRVALEHAFNGMALDKVCGEVLANNQRSIRFHLNLGFQQEGVLRDQHLNVDQYCDVIRFGLLKHEWKLQGLQAL